jgi:hypothetical protein
MAVGALCLSVVLSSGCDRGAKRIAPPSVNPATAAGAALEEFDANKDGKISGEELDKCPSLKSAVGRLDPKGEGIKAEAIQNTIEQWHRMKIGRVAYTIQVLHNGRPLPDATVSFVPEKFLGSSFQTAVGKTGPSGGAQMSYPNTTPAGVATGFYRVEITKDGESIPAKYNTESILGAGVVGPVSGLAAVYNLKY